MTTKRLGRKEKLELEIAQKQAQLKDLEARERVKLRKEDTRRKIIAGSLALQHAASNDDFRSLMWEILTNQVLNVNDRKLFDLPPVETKGSQEQ